MLARVATVMLRSASGKVLLTSEHGDGVLGTHKLGRSTRLARKCPEHMVCPDRLRLPTPPAKQSDHCLVWDAKEPPVERLTVPPVVDLPEHAAEDHAEDH